MKKFDLKSYGVQELSEQEKIYICGGAEYAKYRWYSGTNPILYLGSAFYNAGVTIYNAGVYIYNKF